MRSMFARGFGEAVPEVAAEAGLGLAGGVLFFLLATPTGRQWLQKGAAGCAQGAAMAGGAIGSLFADLRTGWTELIQEVRQTNSNAASHTGGAH